MGWFTRMSRRNKIVTASVAAALVVVVVAAGVVASSGGGGKQAATSTTTTTIAPTTTTKAPPIAPLTGLVDPSGASLTRPALSVKVENTDAARPQTGIDQADVVYEEVVEGQITRFLAMFNSKVPDTIGPVRSVRAIDPDLVWSVGGIFAYSGGAAINVDSINNAPVHTVDESSGTPSGAMQRNVPGQPPRDAPHNLYGHGPQLFALGGQPTPPPALFQYVANGSPPVTGEGVSSMHLGFAAGYDPTYVWDAASGSWKRSLNGAPHTVVGGTQIAPTNVIVQFTAYTGDAEANLLGQGDAWIFSDGTLRVGRWIRPDHTQPARYVDATGAVIALRPGSTWVELLPNGAAVDVVKTPVAPTTVPTTTTPPTTTTKAKKKS